MDEIFWVKQAGHQWSALYPPFCPLGKATDTLRRERKPRGGEVSGGGAGPLTTKSGHCKTNHESRDTAGLQWSRPDSFKGCQGARLSDPLEDKSPDQLLGGPRAHVQPKRFCNEIISVLGTTGLFFSSSWLSGWGRLILQGIKNMTKKWREITISQERGFS